MRFGDGPMFMGLQEPDRNFEPDQCLTAMGICMESCLGRKDTLCDTLQFAMTLQGAKGQQRSGKGGGIEQQVQGQRTRDADSMAGQV